MFGEINQIRVINKKDLIMVYCSNCDNHVDSLFRSGMCKRCYCVSVKNEMENLCMYLCKLEQTFPHLVESLNEQLKDIEECQNVCEAHEKIKKIYSYLNYEHDSEDEYSSEFDDGEELEDFTVMHQSDRLRMIQMKLKK